MAGGSLTGLRYLLSNGVEYEGVICRNMFSRQIGTRFGNPARNVWNPNYLNHVSRVAQTQGLTMGEKPGFSSDNSSTRAPWISAVPPQKIGRVQNVNSFDYHQMVPAVPFYKGQRIPIMGGVENLIDPGVGEPLSTIQTSAPAQMIGAMLFVLMLSYLLFRR